MWLLMFLYPVFLALTEKTCMLNYGRCHFVTAKVILEKRTVPHFLPVLAKGVPHVVPFVFVKYY